MIPPFRNVICEKWEEEEEEEGGYVGAARGFAETRKDAVAALSLHAKLCWRYVLKSKKCRKSSGSSSSSGGGCEARPSESRSLAKREASQRGAGSLDPALVCCRVKEAGRGLEISNRKPRSVAS